MIVLPPLVWALLALFCPLLAAIFIGLFARYSGRFSSWLSLAAVLTSLGAAITLLRAQLARPERFLEETVRWLPQGGETLAELGIRLDGTSITMLVVVTAVATLVQVFSLEYMQEESSHAFGRYFGYHSLFVFSMNLLVLAPNLLQLFLGWELVGLTSYLLIGFYWRKPSAARAAVKAFWMTKLADMGLVLGLVVLFTHSGGFSWTATLTPEVATWVSGLLFLAVMGKSAQFPLHVWLPDAMEGPTPVSALLHAATMVAAGVYLIVRTFPLFEQAPDTLTVMTYLGAFTALFAAVIAVVQTDIKKVLAYSTCSQLGYMIAALGAGSVMAGYFHLTTHACFKALLFLGAGAVIHAVHSNELSKMGGLSRSMKLTTVTFVIGALALAGVPGLAGFFSKDLILETLYEKRLWVPLGLLLAAAGLTAFYMGRVVLLAFFGEPRSRAAEHAHDGDAAMSAPLIALAVATVGVGYAASRFAALIGASYAFHVGPVGVLGTALGLGGLALAYMVYGSGAVRLESFALLAPVGRLARSGGVDRAWQYGFRRIALGIAAAVGFIDRYVIDGFMNFLGWGTIVLARRLRRLQTGNVSDYVLAVVVGTIALVAWGLYG